MCLYNKFVRNQRYIPNKKNQGRPPLAYDERVLYVPTGCGKCIECAKQKARNWQVRLLEDIKLFKNGKFVTFTFNNESIKKINDNECITYKNGDTPVSVPIRNMQGYAKDNAIAKTAVRYFLERWRKKYGKSLRHWLVTELGHNGTENIHLHGIVWPDNEEQWHTISNIWHYGYTWTGNNVRGRTVNYVNDATVNYITKYINKIDLKHQLYKPMVLTSAGIGKAYTHILKWEEWTFRDINGNWSVRKYPKWTPKKNIVNKFAGRNTQETYHTRERIELPLPIYFRNNIYNENEREKLWLNRLDKMERWVCGEKVDISKNDLEYLRLLEHYRKQNKELGYGDGKKNWNRLKYETERRQLMYLTRMADPTKNINQQHIDRNATDTNTTEHHKGLDWGMPLEVQPMIEQNELVKYYNKNINTSKQGLSGYKIRNLIDNILKKQIKKFGT